MADKLAGDRGPGRAVAEAAEPEHDEGCPAEPALATPLAGLAVADRTAGGPAVRVGSADDPAEVEADATARSIVAILRSVNPVRSVAPVPKEHAGDCAVHRTAALVGAEGGDLDAGTAADIDRLRGAGQPLPGPIRHSMETAFGADLSDVRVHTGGTAARLNHAVQARAFTAGRDIVFADGMPDTGTAAGQHLLAHELTHVLQNRDGGPVRRTLRLKGAKADTSWADLQQEPDVGDASAVAQLILRYWANSNRVNVVYPKVSTLVNKAAKALPDMDDDFADSLESLAEVKEVEASLNRRKATGTKLAKAVAARRQVLESSFGKQLGSGYFLPEPNSDSRYKTPSSMLSSVAETSGRDDGAWVSVSNPMTGLAGKTTGSVNLALLEEAEAQGSIFHIGSEHQQICATCGKATDATMFEVDHQQAFSDIRDQLHLLASAMTSDISLYQSVSSQTADFDKIFQVTGKPGNKGFQVEALASGVHMYSNDLDNLMRICRRCNGPWGKSDMDMVTWYKSSPLYGQQFLDSYGLPGSKQVIARTKKDLGWGFAAREWFTQVHLPVLKQQELISIIQESVRQRLISQSNLGVSAKLSTDPVQQQQMQDDTDQLGRDNTALLGGLRTVHDYHSGSKGQQPSAFSPGSPLRIENEYTEVQDRREKRKRTENLKGTKAYLVGLEDGQQGLAVHRGDYPVNTNDLEAYDQGYAEGASQSEELERKGKLDALKWDLTKPHPGPDGSGPLPYEWGYHEMLGRRQQARKDGFALVEQDEDPDESYASGELHAEQLLRDYLAGYKAARQQARQQKAQA
ncbi:MAG TPA: DUF4157 domain-containing protein, partial [Jatrophihabitans sp.]|nr:DUF4157 domain-containing protein [Jatrophihabitans sp.]